MIPKIVEYLDILYPNPRCELNYEKDYELLLAVMMSAQTTDKRVNMVTDILFKKYPTLDALAHANVEDIIDIIRPIGTYQRKANNIISISKSLLENTNGIVPNDRVYLESLSGIGHKTVNVVLSNLYGENCMAVDTHVSRVSKRLGLAKPKDDVVEIEKKLVKKFKGYSLSRLHHQFVLFGRYHCKAMSPLCENCKLQEFCLEYQKKNKKKGK